jgi:hypothetical protein
MDTPTVLNPWYVLVDYLFEDGILSLAYYMDDPEGKRSVTVDKKRAALFRSLVSAARIAQDEEYQILVIYNKDQLDEYREDVR